MYSANIKNIRTKPKIYKNIGRKCCARFNGIFYFFFYNKCEGKLDY